MLWKRARFHNPLFFLFLEELWRKEHKYGFSRAEKVCYNQKKNWGTDMRILVIRHGESEADILNVHEGRADFELTERGHKQAAAMACYVKEHYKVDKIYASTLKRAAQTAEHLAKETGAPVMSEDKLMEFNNGLIAGLSPREADERYPRVMGLPIHESVYEQESQLEFRYRADYMVSKILSENGEEDTIAIVSHGGMINQLYHSFLRMPVESGALFGTGDTGIHEWRVSGKARYVMMANFTGHTEKIAEN